ncbi:TetR/AcrR family transcriptional regulator [Uliginosibacterium gangwonense]|uniref:TetR/AcrR family transcriptional regulator n=1 Tax=Uliginosibacterium gangwonense TaxID=392736 RepID=UPI00035D1355|nr:TetR family transcriptional regulator [Uliginosibacterium gangwonense]
MKVTKAQAQANRARVVETASTLFREHGYDGIGVADLMAAAGFTHGGFYKHFGSKADLMAEAAACSIAQTAELAAGADMLEFVRQYLSREHRDTRATGCTMAALCGDAARQPEALRAIFAAGIEGLITTLCGERAAMNARESAQLREKTLNTFAHAVGAMVMSRACPDNSPLADEILSVCCNEILASLRPPITAQVTAHDEGIDGFAKPKQG